MFLQCRPLGVNIVDMLGIKITLLETQIGEQLGGSRIHTEDMALSVSDTYIYTYLDKENQKYAADAKLQNKLWNKRLRRQSSEMN